ncbi:MAG: 50S ribosomal protein L33 [Elusimicrobia bacterium RIFOXYB2_FULL_48_7]|nr:MAG: 50S ribosomal protein L33 [Elusimicrobia bacterium RIFOXYB2_FULL_48_7]
MGERVIKILVCSVCKNKNYHYVTGKKKEYKVDINKFCKKCRKHTPHKETK